MSQKRILEICANSAESCIEAEKGGASRVELCAAIPEGGTTPSYGEIKVAQESIQIPINVIIRPRGGDFLYSENELKAMLYDIELCKQLGVHGVVIGCLTAEGEIDKVMLKQLMDAAKPELSVTFHRAFDVCKDPFKALEEIIEAGCDRILTSGQQSTAFKGIDMLKQLVEKADGRIIIMPGCGVNEDNIAELANVTGAKEFHTSARSRVYSGMIYRNENVPMGSCTTTSEFERDVTDSKRVAACL